jgi:hypothetical protein
MTHRDQERLRQPGCAERRGEMGEGAIGRADQHHGITALRKQAHHPARDVLSPDALEATRRDRLENRTRLVDLTPHGAGQAVRRDRHRAQRAGHAQIGEIFAVQMVGQGAHHGRGGIEVGKIRMAHYGRGSRVDQLRAVHTSCS